MNRTAEDVTKYTLFVVQGGVIFAGNLLIVMTIVRHPALRHRKELIIVSGLSLADLLNGVAFLSAGIYRLFLVLRGNAEVLVTQWACMLTVHNLIWIFSETTAAAMLLVISVDRLLAVSVPLRYFRSSVAYAQSLLAMTFIYGVTSGLIGLFVSYRTSEFSVLHQAICFTRMATGSRFYDYFSMCRVVFGSSSIAVYIIVMVVYVRQQNQTKLAAAAYQRRIIKRQRKLTASLGISCVFTFFFYVLPHSAVFLESISGAVDKSIYSHLQVHTYLFMMANLNSLFNLFIFVIRHQEMRNGMCSLCGIRTKTGEWSFVHDTIFRASGPTPKLSVLPRVSRDTDPLLIPMNWRPAMRARQACRARAASEKGYIEPEFTTL